MFIKKLQPKVGLVGYDILLDELYRFYSIMSNLFYYLIILDAEHHSNNNNIHHNEGQVPELVLYPDNLNLKDLSYFILAPTLCYELNFPKTTRIRKRFLIKRVLEVLIGAHIVMGLFQQWMIPSVNNSLVPFSNMDVAKMTERLLKLAVSIKISL